MPKFFENIADEYTSHVLSLENFKLFSEMDTYCLNEDAQKAIMQMAESFLDVDYQPILAHSYMRYEENGNRSIYEGE